MRYSSSEYEIFWTSELGRWTRSGDHLRAACPIHGGDNPSTLSVDLKTGHAKCHKCHSDGESWSMVEFAMVRHGLDQQAASEYVRDILGSSTNGSSQPDPGWQFPFPRPYSITSDTQQLIRLAQRILNYANYLDVTITPSTPGWKAYALYVYRRSKAVKTRFQHKDTGAKRLSWLALTEKGGWKNPTKLGLAIEVYLADTLDGAEEIYLLNGEKAVDRAVAEWGIVATCLPNGEAHWRPEYLTYFRGAKTVYLVMDNDPTGAHHGKLIGSHLTKGGVTTRLVALPGLPPKGDLFDFIEAGGTLKAFQEIAAASPLSGAEPPPKEKRERTRLPAVTVTFQPTGDEPDLLPFEYTDSGNALRLALYKGSVLRYAAELESPWLYFDGVRWRRGDVQAGYQAAQDTLHLLQVQAGKLNADTAEKIWKFANNKLNSGGIHAMLDLARGLLCIDLNEFDRHPFLVNCSNGCVNLETGEFRPHRPEDYFTRCFPYPYDPTLPLPEQFLTALAESFGSTPDASIAELEYAERMTDYFQRIFGYLLTGSVTLKAFFIIYGSGNNGKSSIIGALQDVLGEYAVTISPSTLTTARFRNPNNTFADIARTVGKRAVFTAEPSGKAGFDQAELKRLTQGDMPIEAVFKGRNPFEFLPTGKLIIEANSVPEFDAADKPFIDRMHLIEFRGSFPTSVGKTKRQQLEGELPQIFNFGLAGAYQVIKDGLCRPLEYAQSQLRTVRDQQARENDDLEPFIEDCLNVGSGKREDVAAIDLLAYRPWCERNRVRPMSRNHLSRQLSEREGIRRGSNPKNHKEKAWLDGVEIKPELKRVAVSGRAPMWKEPTDD